MKLWLYCTVGAVAKIKEKSDGITSLQTKLETNENFVMHSRYTFLSCEMQTDVKSGIAFALFTLESTK